MLPPLYALGHNDLSAAYDVDLARRAQADFLSSLPAGEADFYEGVRRMYSYLYQRALSSSDKHYFLDKTPRYYLICSELARVFPEAQFIFLLRNPLAVLASILKTWVKQNWPVLRAYREDLLAAPTLLLDGINTIDARSIVVHYEALVRHPSDELQRLCSHLGVDFEPSLVDYGHPGATRWQFGDRKTVYEQQRPISSHADEWTRSPLSPQEWHLMRDYLHLLGPETIRDLGYSFDEFSYLLHHRKPPALLSHLTIPTSWLLGPSRRRNSNRRDDLVALVTSLQQRGVRKTAVSGGRRLLDVFSNAN